MAAAFLFIAAVLTSPGPFVLVNGSGAALEELAVRPADGSADWRPLGGGRLSQGARSTMPAPAGQLCAFDLRARSAGALVTWSSVNLCDVKVVTLNRRPDGTVWADYD